MRILAIGTATLDIINQVDRYPQEDDEVRALAQRRVAGGNAVNTLLALRQLGYDCAWGGVVADDSDSRHVLEALQRHGIDTSACVCVPGGKIPTSYICLSRATASRTIVHFRDLPEYGAEDFRRVALDVCDWVHFEGRNPEQILQMQARLKERRPGLRCSLEVEKPRPNIESLFPTSSVVLFSRAFARACGFQDGAAFLRALGPETGSAPAFCAWGEGGAYAMDRAGQFYHSPAFPPPTLVDTLGAGDVFNAAVIDGMLQNRPIGRVLGDACRLAGRKCGLEGITELRWR